MKLFLHTGAVIGLIVAVLNAKDPPLPERDTRSPVELAPQLSSTPVPATPAPQLIPADVLPAPKNSSPAPKLPSIEQLDEGFKPPPLSLAADNQRKHFEWRRLRNTVQNDRDLKAALKASEAAPTDLEKRKLLRRYYDLFYDRISARAAPEMKNYLAARKADALRSLPQPRVRPGTSLPIPSSTTSPSPTPDSPTPSPSLIPETLPASEPRQ